MNLKHINLAQKTYKSVLKMSPFWIGKDKYNYWEKQMLLSQFFLKVEKH